MRGGPRLAVKAGGAAAGIFGALAAVYVAAARAVPPDAVSAVALPGVGRAIHGWSGIDVSHDGSQFWAVTDFGAATSGRLLRDGAGRLVGVEAPSPVSLDGPNGEILHAGQSDIEGIDMRPSDGTAHVVFEMWNRLRMFPPGSRTGQWRPDIPKGAVRRANAGLEAVASDRFGRIYAIPERPPRGAADMPVLRFTRRAWMTVHDWQVAFYLERERPWRVTGADFGPDGALYVLERRFLGPVFASRIRRVADAAAVPRGAHVRGTVVYESPFGRHGNLEGLAIWVDPEGRVRAVMVSDDNGNAWQRAEMVEVPLPLAQPDQPE
ncbi:MAG: esterase-like activity of phytase family protein [Pseudomonadota bacterium]